MLFSIPPTQSPLDVNFLPVVQLEGLSLAAVRESELVDHVFSSLNRNRGGMLVTANLDFLARAHEDLECRRLYGDADVVVADGMPLVWAAWLQGTPIPQRIAGADQISARRPPATAARPSRQTRKDPVSSQG